jgi:copper resistance protein B
MKATIHCGSLWLAAAVLSCVAAMAQAQDMHQPKTFAFVQGEQFEYRTDNRGDARISWDVRGWTGGDYQRLWFKTQGDAPTEGPIEKSELQLRYSHLVSPFWSLMLGARYDLRPSPSRGYAVLALHGLAPYFLETDADLFVSEEGDVSARLEVEYPLLLTQRLILVPSFEFNFAVQEVEELGVGSGFSDVELGLRLRYEVTREFAPYIGFSWERKLGHTADLFRDLGEVVESSAFVAGVRFWF